MKKTAGVVQSLVIEEGKRLADLDEVSMVNDLAQKLTFKSPMRQPQKQPPRRSNASKPQKSIDHVHIVELSSNLTMN